MLSAIAFCHFVPDMSQAIQNQDRAILFGLINNIQAILERPGFSCEKIDTDIKTTIKRALFRLPIKKKELALSISGQSVVLSYVNMPIMSHEEIVKAMNFELEKYMPFNKKEIIAIDV